MSRSQLAPGVEVVAVPGRDLAVRTAEGEFLSVRTQDADKDALLSRLAGATTAPADDELHRVVRAFEQAGYLTDEPQHPEWPAARRGIRLLGDPVLTEPLAAHLAALGAVPHTTSAAPAPEASPRDLDDLLHEDPAAVVWCLDGPVPDGLWDAADMLPERGVAWLRCHREGWQAYVEPLAAAPGDVTSAHIRARRLAATPAHRELAAYWSGPRTSGAPVRLTVPAAGLLAALLADDLRRWAIDAPDAPGSGGLPARRRLRRVDLRTLTVTEHPVLPVPEAATMPKTKPKTKPKKDG
ncbi:hypothetical protein [Streptomyces poonensis]|uniref:Uncharacterized protein n=1 Tax=Streptomyces poonensis TaxID=68255 RepID=A0A918UXS3_9ACTN|nr:hypothetical protein [Streptomyces poonensis]GGZ43601.1 hypothetical protein GCM10010365_75220 [Streptomyces poonensis]GLJ91693.1 hypothetical protein GCM10017589_43000 [Streptomyces poonensis]